MQLFGMEKLIMGFSLGRETCQMSYLQSGDKEAKTLSYTGVTEEINMPVLLTKRNRINQWYYGSEAQKYANENSTLLISDLLKKSLADEKVVIEDREYSYRKLLALFVRRALSAINSVGSMEKTELLAFTCDEMPDGILDVFEEIKEALHLKNTKIEVYTYEEAFFAYMMHQPVNLWENASVLIREEGNKLISYTLEQNKNTRPVAVNIDRHEYSFMDMKSMISDGAGASLDSAFAGILPEIIGNKNIDSVYLCGEGFNEEWMSESLKMLCHGRRVFLGDNLFSKGAAYCIYEKNYPTSQSDNYVYLGGDKIKINIGMNITTRGRETYWALIDAGISYSDADVKFEFYMDHCDEVKFCVTPIMGDNRYEISVPTPEIADRITRAMCLITFKSATKVLIEVMDKGFGNITNTTNKVWSKEIDVTTGE